MSSFDFASLPGQFAHLVVVFEGRDDQAVQGEAFFLRFNNDSATNYDYFTSDSSTYAGGQTKGWAGRVSGASATTASAGSSMVVIPNYAATSMQKVYHGLSGDFPTNGSSTAAGAFYFAGKWYTSNTAINRITLLPSAGNFVAGSRATIYGLA